MANEAAREVILGRIRAAVAADEHTAPQPSEWPARTSSSTETATSRGEMITLFAERLRDYDAVVERTSAEEVAEAVGRVLLMRRRPRMIAPTDFNPAWIPPEFGIELDRGFSARDLDAFDGVITGAALGIAETGTLVLQAVAGQGRRALSLVPDFHLCILCAKDVVATVPQAITRLAATSALPTTFVSGPSATADIEMTRIKGVHGPRFLHVLLVGEG